MANPSNLIRPPILNTQNLTNERQTQRQEEQQNRNMATSQQITELVGRMIAQQVPRIIEALNNPEHDFTNAIDQEILEEHRGNLGGLDKIPDVVKCLREFSGDPAEFSSWKKSVDRLMEAYAGEVGTSRYFGILHSIRSKITGNADTALEAYSVPLNWRAMAKCLTMHYGDKRDLGTLEYQMTMLSQGNLTIEEFHQLVYQHLSLLLNKVNCMDLGAEAHRLLKKMYRDKATDTFICGLRGDLPRILGAHAPRDLPSALNICLKMENQKYRTMHAVTLGQANNKNTNVKPIPAPRSMQFVNSGFRQQPPVPPRNRPPQYPQIIQPQNYNNFGQQRPLAMPRQYDTNQNRQQQFAPPRPMAPKPQPRPEPMDVDTSIRSRMVNYMNRPQFELGKRPPGPMPDATKRQRNFNIQTDDSEPTEMQSAETHATMAEYAQAVADQEDGTQDETLDEYIDGYDNDENTQYDSSAMNFLE